MFKLFGISVAFVATRSGLLRWQDISTIENKYVALPMSKSNSSTVYCTSTKILC